MRTKTAAAVLAAGLITGGGAALIAPGSALAADSSASASVTDRAASRLGALKNALSGLVKDGKINQAQADKVASTLAAADLGGHGGRGPGGGRLSPEATAKVLGITAEQLRTELAAGKTLTAIASAHGVSRTDLINGLVAAAKAQLAADVKSGEITQAQADQASANLTSRITERVDQVGFGRGGHRHGGNDNYADDNGATPGSTAPGSTAPGSTAPGSTAPGSPAPSTTAPSPSATS